jgi:hypothetical protein
MRVLTPLGWVMVGIGAALLAGSLAGGQPLVGAIPFAALGGGGAFTSRATGRARGSCCRAGASRCPGRP